MKSPLTDSLTLLLVASGTALSTFLGATTLDFAPLETLCLSFVAAIIAVYLIPALMHFSSMIKSLFFHVLKQNPLQSELHNRNGSDRHEQAQYSDR